MATGRVRFGARIRTLGGWFRRSLALILQPVFGSWSWEPPRWLQRGLEQAAAAGGRLRERPRAALLGLALIAAGAAGGYAGWQWWEAQPKPVLVTYKVTEPGPLRVEDSEARPEPLLVEFAASVAPLKDVGKEAGAGIAIDPKVEGKWRWDGDKVLRFDPRAEWPVGGEFTVALDRRVALAEQVRLADYKIRFRSAPFAVKVTEAKFYQDPVDPAAKKVVATVNFSHPVDTADFEKRITLRLAGQSEGILGLGAQTTPFKVSYDKWKVNAFVHSEPLPIPAKPTTLDVLVDAGARAARGGPPAADKILRPVSVPGLYSLAVNSVQHALVNNERFEPEQLLVAEASSLVNEQEMGKSVSAWLLPPYHPSTKPEERRQRHNWEGDKARIGAEILQQSEALKLQPVPTERENSELHSFKYQAEPGRYVYVKVARGLKSFGGYQLGRDLDFVVKVPPFPRELRIMAAGSLLALSGEKKLSVVARDVEGIRFEIGRLLPQQIQHLVSQAQGGSFSRPEFSFNFDESNITERFSQVIELPTQAPGKPQYQSLDLARYLEADGGRRGVFLLRAESYDPAARRTTGALDKRLVVVTDLGILVKRSVDDSQDVFVQSIHTGDPVAGATVEVIGKNGQSVLAQATDAAGRAHFPDLRTFVREKQPTLYIVRKAGDVSFLPINRHDRQLDYSRFDIGGVANAADSGKLSAYLFSDRGIYRPGEEIRIGMIVKATDWTRKLAGIPLEAELLDARGLAIKRERLRLSPSGFEALRHTTQDTAPTGDYSVNLYIVKDGRPDSQIGALVIKVQEFTPDRLKMSARLSSEAAEGWVSPQDLKARINLQNLFGTPAENRRVTGTLTLSPAYPAFAGFRDYTFYDPQRAKEGVTEQLKDAKSDDKGEAEFDLNLGRFARATYRLHFLAQGFEADGGRGVTAETAQLVSNMPWLVGYKADGDLGYVSRGAERRVDFIAIDAQAKRTAVDNLTIQQVERKFVSVLTRQDNGTFKYESRKKEVLVGEQPLAIAAGGARHALATGTPGNFAVVVRDAQGQELARVEYNVAGQANLSRSLEKNAELQLTLSRKDFARGDEIELQIQAPYTGAGLITIEREKVHAAQWFKAGTTSSVQKIRLPKDFDGNGYVTVTFIRDPASDEIHASPLSYGVVPFSVSLDSRRTAVQVAAPDLVKPGETMKFRYKTDQPARIVVFAVDEGILQVARYKNADPLGFFFQKRALEVRTAQILDLIIPEFKRVMAAAAAGGDGEGALGRHLNPFKRKRDQPVAYWSGILDSGPEERELTYTVPDAFNGTLRVMAVAVSDSAVGVFQGRTLVRGDFVISPNVPLTVTPGDEFDISVGVANNVAGSGGEAPIALALTTSPHLEVLGSAKLELKIGEMREGVASFRVKARPQPGAASLQFVASMNGKSAKIGTGISVRPASPFETVLAAGNVRNGTAEVPVSRTMFAEFRKLEASVSPVPLVLAQGLSAYLSAYPYSCTEQIVSQALPALILGERPEFGMVRAERGASLAKLIATLRSRQNGDGGFGLWAANPLVDDAAAVHAVHFLIEARERRELVPQDMLTSANNYLRQLAGSEGTTLADERVRAYAAYLLTRQGVVTSNLAAAVQKRLEDNHAKTWGADTAAAYLAATYQLLKQDRLADKLIAEVKPGVKRDGKDHSHERYNDDLTRDAQIVYLLARHFPARHAALPPTVLENLVKPIAENRYNTYSSAHVILALDAIAALTGGAEVMGKLGVKELLKDGKARDLPLPAGLLPRVNFTADAARVQFSNAGDTTAFYVVNQSGFDIAPPTTEVRQGLEILREYTDAAGKAVKSVKLGDELEVHLKFRGVDRKSIDSVVLVDLLPGGFELVLDTRVPEASRDLTPGQAQQGPGAGGQSAADNEEGDEGRARGQGEPRWVAPIGRGRKSTWQPDYVELREDRVVLYGAIDKDANEFVYRIKATNAGTFVTPPAYGEGMYDRAVKARSLGGTMSVEKR
ncbi:MAG: alpha-2-macroglobulin [Betaproteobacteria bacterium]|nr:alpha-2-macroglobulin [Betaproteobacteria bacterium]